MEETEQYLAGQGFNLLAENENFNLSPVTEEKGKTTGRQKPRKLVVPKSFADQGDSPATDLVRTSQLSSIGRTILPDEKSGVCKEERTYKSKWFDKIKNKFEKTEDDIPSKRKTGSNEITYDEIDDDSDGPYMPTSEVVEEKLKEEEEFYQHPPPPRPLPKKIEAMENDPDKIAVEHIYEEIAPRIVTPVRYRRRRRQNIADPDGKADTGEVVERPAKTKTTSCISSLATCIPWWMAKRYLSSIKLTIMILSLGSTGRRIGKARPNLWKKQRERVRSEHVRVMPKKSFFVQSSIWLNKYFNTINISVQSEPLFGALRSTYLLLVCCCCF